VRMVLSLPKGIPEIARGQLEDTSGKGIGEGLNYAQKQPLGRLQQDLAATF
jgi:hypothetical protein